MEVLQCREHHRIPLLGAQAPELTDHAAERHSFPVPALAERPEVHVGADRERSTDRLQRMRRDVEPHGLLFHGEQLALLKLPGGDRRVARTASRRRTAVATEVHTEIEDRALADLGVLLRLLTSRLRLFEYREHAHARCAGGAKGAALDQRLDRLLVHSPAVDALAEVKDVDERPIRTRGFDRLHGRVADPLYGIQPEADVAVDHHETVV